MMLSEKKQYPVRSKTLGTFYISFSRHARQRLVERGINLLEVIAALSTHSQELAEKAGRGELAFLDDLRSFSILLSVSKTEKDVYYMNVITLLNDVPRTEAGLPRFTVSSVIEATM